MYYCFYNIVFQGSSCTQELQALFGCLKKWEFDDKPCGKQHTAYMGCVHEAERVAKEFKEAAEKVCIDFCFYITPSPLGRAFLIIRTEPNQIWQQRSIANPC